MATYRVEKAKTGRAGCKGHPDCKDQKIKIEKGELRFGTWVEGQQFSGWHWRHWGCVTPLQMNNLKETCGGDMEMVDGYEEIDDEEMQEKIERCIEQEHVDDEEWRGEEGYNRPGQKGYGPRKQRKSKKDVDDGEDKEEAGPNKRKAENDEASAPAKKSRKKAIKTKAAEDITEETVEEKPKARARKKVVKEETDADEEAEDVPVKQTRPRGRKKAVKEETESEDEPVDEDDDAEPEPEPPKKKGGRGKKAVSDVASQKKTRAKGKKA